MKLPRLVERTSFALFFTVAAVLIGVTYLGCGSQDRPTAPSNPTAISFVPVPASLHPLSSGSGGSSGSGKTEKYIIASQGGRVTAGRHTVIIPPGALYQNTTIRVEDESDGGFVRCELRPHGITFRTPVTLVTQFSELAEPAGYTMFWGATSPITGADLWVNVGGQETADHTGIQVQLNHFSEYMPGKAGW